MKKTHDPKGQKELTDTEFQYQFYHLYHLYLDQLDDFYDFDNFEDCEYTYEEHLHHHILTYDHKYSYEDASMRKVQPFCKECHSML